MDHVQKLVAECMDTYKFYIPELERKREVRIVQDYLDRLALMDKRRNVSILMTIKGLMSKIHFVAIMTLHDNQEMR